ncbi:hypothetical protein ACSNN7_10080 [Micromonospora sp. URMC 105]|uniref:hypothetical protein n=1 Tax=Micromonospora sp. URMC 105 TaxID=3423413 RepID=UPI003F1A1473
MEFLPGAGDDPATVENIDARIHRSDGVGYYATFMTTDEIARVLTRWNGSGEFGADGAQPHMGAPGGGFPFAGSAAARRHHEF